MAGGRDAAREAEAAALRRLERDIHDGPQQRLVRLAMDLGRAQRSWTGTRSAVGATSTRRSCRPARRWRAALPVPRHRPADPGRPRPARGAAALASGCPVPVELDRRRARRGCLPHVETAAYFVVAEALTNVAKHSRATGARRAWPLDRASVAVRVEDDGVGGAHAGQGPRPGRAGRPASGGRRAARVDSPDGGPTVLTRGCRWPRVIAHEDRGRRRRRTAAGGTRSGCSARPATRWWPRSGTARRSSRRASRSGPTSHRGRADAAEPHRRGAAGRRRGTPGVAAARRSWSSPSTSRSPTPTTCSPTATEASATCSRTGSATWTTSSPASPRSPRAAPCSIRRWSASCVAGAGRPARRRSPRGSGRCSALMAEGRSNTAIAAALVVTDGAVEKHIRNDLRQARPAARRRRRPPAGARGGALPASRRLRSPQGPVILPSTTGLTGELAAT